MNVVVNRIVRGRYLDSVSLMRMSRKLSSLAGIVEAAVMIGSDTNKRLMRDSGLLQQASEGAKPTDLVVGIAAQSRASADAALAELDAMLAHRDAARPSGEAFVHARALATAREALPDADLALISVPGEFAAAEAASALRAGMHVLLFSNNVSLDDERRLKDLARERGLLLMGPDCGTSLVDGVPLAFANVVPRGNVGLVAASGTGLRGITTLMALDALDEDARTEHVVIISKPPAPRVAQAVVDRIARSAKTFTVCLLGRADVALPGNAKRAHTLRDAAELALGGKPIAPDFVARAMLPAPGRRRRVRGLYTGGTLCAEAQLVLLAAGERVASNAPVPGAHTVSDVSTDGATHTIVDLGADEYTRGRPHPMIEPAIRDAPLHDALADAATGVVLLDVVIGYGADPDPAGVVARALATVPGRRATVIASVCGTEADPQVYSRQVRTLESAGVIVAPSNAHAAELTLRALRSD